MTESAFFKKPAPPPPPPEIDCSHCGEKVYELKKIEAGMRLTLQKENIIDVPAEVCERCYKEFERSVSKGAKLRAEAMARDQQRLYLWKNRTNLIKQARSLMAEKVYSEAAINYEKYLKILEVVYHAKSGDLTPEMFKGRPTELTVIASVYWDLLRVYDTHPKYVDRQMDAAKKLSQFIRFTPLLPEVSRKAQNLVKTGKNPDAFRSFLKWTDTQTARCFIATAAFEGFTDPTVDTLRIFRDRVLRYHWLGRRLVLAYYRFSPYWAEKIKNSPLVKRGMRYGLRGVASFLKAKFNLQG